ncbi:MAG: CapA family protein [Alphaproteobacteria bacterium]|nr:CapA family protein [Alphaproteobacteria bacterium]
MVPGFLTLLPLALGGPGPLGFANAPSCPARAVEIAMVGDVMQHGMQLKASRQDDGSTSWHGVFDPVAPLLRGADLALANLETPIDASQDFGGFPLFNAPESLLVALREAGFDVLQTANNHCLDRGRAGALATLEAVERHGFGSAGTWKSAEARDTPWVLRELPGPVTVAFLAYTYGTNGRPMPEGEPWLVNWLDDGQMQHDVARAREVADVVVVGIHWGAEYQHQPQPWQRALAQSLVEAGADVVMGSHPHVLQPAEVVPVERPEGRRDAVILYSLGNFVSNQRTPYRDGGMIARVTLATCADTGEHHVVDARFTPVWVDDRLADGELAFRVLPVPPEGAACPTGLDLSEADCKRMEAFRDHTATLFPASAFDWATGPNAWTARRPVADRLRPRGFLEPQATDPEPGAVGTAWPPPALLRTQRDPLPR